MLIDTFVLVSIHNKKSGFEELLRIITAAERRLFSVVSYLEFVMVTKNVAWIDGFIKTADLERVSTLPVLTLEIASYMEQQKLRKSIYCLRVMTSLSWTLSI